MLFQTFQQPGSCWDRSTTFVTGRRGWGVWSNPHRGDSLWLDAKLVNQWATKDLDYENSGIASTQMYSDEIVLNILFIFAYNLIK